MDQTWQRYLRQGLSPAAAADAALAEFGDQDAIVAQFTRLSPARRAARKILATGPIVGGCWGLALITGHAWAWPVPAVWPLVLGLALVSNIGLLAAAAFGKTYRYVGRAGVAGCVGMSALDTVMLLIVMLAIPAIGWPVTLAAAASGIRLTLTSRTLRPMLTG